MELQKPVFPIGDRVLVVIHDKDKMTKSGYHIPDTSGKGEKQQSGEIIAMGTGEGNDNVNPGDYFREGVNVLFGEYAGVDLQLKDTDGKNQKCKMLRFDSIEGTIQ